MSYPIYTNRDGSLTKLPAGALMFTRAIPFPSLNSGQGLNSGGTAAGLRTAWNRPDEPLICQRAWHLRIG